MKIFSWVQNKFIGRQGSSNKAPCNATISHSPRVHEREEFIGWPNEILAIGTLWNSPFKEEPKGCKFHDVICPSNDFSREEIGQLHEKLNALFSQDSPAESSSSTGRSQTEFLLDNILLYSQDTWTETSHGQVSCGDHDQAETDRFLKSISEASSNKQDVCPENGNKGIKKKSLYFLLKKMVAWRNGFGPAPNFRDPVLYPESRMEKILSAILMKKIHPQSAGHTMAVKKNLTGRHISRPKNDDRGDSNDENLCEKNNRSKWVKTDTEYIVLEI